MPQNVAYVTKFRNRALDFLQIRMRLRLTESLKHAVVHNGI